MECREVRESLSAALDGEPATLPAPLSDAHLTSCAGCRAWQHDAQDVVRRMRLASATPSRDLTSEILARVPVRGGRDHYRGRVTTQRSLLLIAGIAQLAITVPLLILGHTEEGGRHVAHELGSFDFALAVAFVVGALRPRLSGGLAWPCGIAAGGMFATALIDILMGHQPGIDEMQHLIAGGGAALLFWGSRLYGSAPVPAPQRPTFPPLRLLQERDSSRMRLFRRIGYSVFAGGALLLALAPAAFAHVSVNPGTQAPGTFGELTFRAPNESAAARFTKLVLHLPAAEPFGSLNARTITGWTMSTATAKLPKPITTDDGTTTEYTSEVTWTATGADAGIPPEQYQDFALSVGPFPEKGSMTFTVDQYYSDGSVVHWDQPTPASGVEPEHPAPVLTLAAEASKSSSDGTARGLGIAALAVAVLALLNTIVVHRRKKPRA